MKKYSRDDIKQEICSNAKALAISEKWAELIAEKTAQHIDAWVEGRSAITNSDLRRVAYQKLELLSPDIAYIYKNYDRII